MKSKAAANIFWPVAGLLLAIMGTAQVTSVLQESQTYDEGTHLAAGYSYLKTGDYRLNPEHPPLGKILPALPLLFFKPHLPLESVNWKISDQREFAREFLYKNRVPADTMLFAGRCVTILCTLGLGLVLAIWTRRHFGAAVALFALVLYAFDPNLTAHGRYVTNDVLLSFTLFLACIAWNAYLSSRRRGDLVWSGITVGLALISKFSGVVVVPILAALYGIKWWQERAQPPARKPLSLSHLANCYLVMAVIAGAIIALSYARETIRLTVADEGHYVPLQAAIEHKTLAGKFLYRAGEFLDLPAYSYLVGLESAARHDRLGQPTYLLGRLSEHGWWYYFPVAFAVKTPAAVLLLLLICIPAVPWPRLRLRGLRFDWYVLAVPIAIYFPIAMRSRLNIGLRHILPVYPFLFVLLAAVLFRSRLARFRRAFPALVCLLVVVEAAESASIYPHYLAFFNVFAGGPAHGPDYLVDSNIDWGQDLKNLKAWWTAHGRPPLCMTYFGQADTEYYQLPWVELPRSLAEAHNTVDCIGAVSVTVLKDVYMKPGEFQWMRELRPIGQVGYSIYLYDLRQRK